MRFIWIGCISLALAACSPTLDWREVTPEGGGIVALFPCRPNRHERAVVLAAAKADMHMLVCAAGGATYALTFADVGEPAAVATALAELRAAALKNIGATAPEMSAWQLAGMTANVQAARMGISGRLPDGAAVREQVAFFAKDLRVYQASVIGSDPSAEAIDGFFSGLRFPKAH